MARRDVVVVGASAGGVEALCRFVSALPPDLPATVLVVLHLPPRGPSALSSILSREGPLPVKTAADGDPLEPGLVYVGAPDKHLSISGDAVSVTVGPQENGHRPAVDVLFRGAARWLGPRVVGVVLSGSLDDGTAGAVAVAEHGGVVLVQDPSDALYPAMPLSVLRTLPVEKVAPVNELGALVGQLCGEPVPEPEPPESPAPASTSAVVDNPGELVMPLEPAAAPGDEPVETSLAFTCPDCGGPLFRVEQGALLTFRCRVGHAWTSQSLAERLDASIEQALWTSVRVLTEKIDLSVRLAERARKAGRQVTAERFQQGSREATQSLATLRHLLAAAAARREHDRADYRDAEASVDQN